MKILCIKGSPRKRANSTALLEKLSLGAESAGAEVRVITPWKLQIAPCLACNRCFDSGRCAVQDDFQTVYDQILACDALVLATPVYFGAVSAQIKPLIDRCESFWAVRYILEASLPPGPSGEQRKGVLIATAGQDREIMFRGVSTTFDFLMRCLQGQVSAELLYGDLDETDSVRINAKAMERAFEVGRSLALGPEADRWLGQT